MKKQTILSSILGIVLLALTACSNNDENAIEKGKVDVAQRIEFKVNFADYNTEQSVNVTRAPKEDINPSLTGKIIFHKFSGCFV